MKNHRISVKVLKPIIFCGIFFVVFISVANAQEFNCTINLNTEQLEGSSFNYIENLKPVLESYINEYNWTEEVFDEEERINCQIEIGFTSGSSDFTFSAEVVFQVQRPVYNTTAKTTTVLLSDNAWQFNYPEGKSLIHDELQFDALTGFIDFYSYVMLGYDFDTFAELGGSDYFGRAQNILNLALTTSAVGWSRNTNNRRNRNMLISDLVSSGYRPLRLAYYQYHRLGLDRFVDEPTRARQEILNALKEIQTAKRRSTSNYLFDIFFDAKSREIAAVFEHAETNIRLEAYEVLRQTDQGHLSNYENLQN
ncbi:MAG: DUF4835 family protein [Gracilimonas sp.]|uniref:type IX secretion system protein PorD n=1 Tax=Gracilimonas sp. TaxID=1974203 RepID=UPI0037501164|nr:DUF4835 family protein [Gracilimonas sp.]